MVLLVLQSRSRAAEGRPREPPDLTHNVLSWRLTPPRPSGRGESTGTGRGLPGRQKRHRSGVRGDHDNGFELPEMPAFAAQGRDASPETVAKVPLAKLSLAWRDSCGRCRERDALKKPFFAVLSALLRL